MGDLNFLCVILREYNIKILLLVKMCEKTRQQNTTFFLYLEQILVVPIAMVERQRVRLEAIFIYLFFFFIQFMVLDCIKAHNST